MIFALDATAPSAPPVPGGRAGSREDLAAAPDSTRERVKQTISEHGPVTAGELAQRLGLTPAAVRRHLESLAEAGLVEEHEKAGAQVRRRGRPARSYVLSEAGHADLRGDYRDLAAEVLHFLAEQGGEAAVAAFAQSRAADLATRLGRHVQDHDRPLAERTEALAAGLRREGYAASARPVGDDTPLAGVQLCQGHCPVRDVAAEFPQICDAEAEMFSALLGVHVQRLATQAQGDHVCTTFVPLTPQARDDAPTDRAVRANSPATERDAR